MGRNMGMRPLTMSDTLFCWRLARDPVVRRASIDRSMPTPLGHLKWMWRWTGRSSSRIAVVITTRGGKRVGIMRASLISHDKAEVGIAITEGFRGKGKGTAFIAWLSPFFADHLMVRTLIAVVRTENRASNNAFYKAGYRFSYYLQAPDSSSALAMRWDRY